MKKRIIEILCICIGIFFIAYPVVSNYVFLYKQTITVSNYQKQIERLTNEQKEEELRKAREYNKDLESDLDVDISFNDNSNAGSIGYYNVLNIGDVMAYVSIPKIDLYLPIYHGTSENVLQFGVGHIETTSLPIGGIGTHCVIAGHTGLTKTKMFDNINKLEMGDVFYIHVLDEVLAYSVCKINVVEPEETDSIKIDSTKDYVTLVTCTPYMINTHRLLVTGERIEASSEDNKNDDKVTQEINDNINIERIRSNRIVGIIISIAIFAVLLIILLFYVLTSKNKKKSKIRNRKGKHGK